MMGLFGFMFWSTAEGRGAKALAVLHGCLMSATRIVGIPCSGYPVAHAIFRNGWRGLADVRSWIKRYGSSIAVMVGATLGAGAFFFYCLLRWGRWDIYMLTQQSGWAIIPDYLAVFRPSSYRWLIPALKNPTEDASAHFRRVIETRRIQSTEGIIAANELDRLARPKQ